MTETIDYAPLIPKEPPEGLTQWVLQQDCLQKEYLIYKAGREYVPLEERNRPAVEVTCSACGRTFLAEKIDAGGCRCGYAGAPFGWMSPISGDSVISGDRTMCPYCGEGAETVHVSAVPNGMSENAYTAVISRLSVPGKVDRLLVSDWMTTRHIGKNGESRFRHHLWTAWVVEERKVVRLMGYSRLFNTLAKHNLEQRKTFLDDFGQYNLLYPWDSAVLEGTTAENSKLDRYIEAGGKSLVAYLALWRRRPAVENLLMQGCGKLVAELIENDQGRSTYERSKGIPQLRCINWKEKKPHLMLHMSKEEFRQWGKGISANDFELLGWARRNGLELQMPSGLLQLQKIGKYRADEIMEATGVGDFWRTVKYLDRNGGDFHSLRDYWRMAGELDMDLTNDQVRWPKDLSAAHDRVMKRYQAHKNELLEQSFAERRAELEKFAWHSDGILIRPCASSEELKQEGKLLRHCVASYAGNHANGKTAIFFIRRESEPDKPWYTLELDEKNLVVRQNRGKRNCAKTPEVQAFEDKWLDWVRSGCKTKKKKSKGVNAA